MTEAQIDGRPASLDAAAQRAAEILSRARLPIVAGLGTDIAGARASIALAERIRGAYDHLESDKIFTDLDVMRQAGRFVTTPNEARLRADVLLFIGKDLTKIWPQLLERLAPAAVPEFDLAHATRKLVWIAPGRAAAQVDGLDVTTIDSNDPHVALASLRARVADRPVNSGKGAKRKIDEIAQILKGARFGVAVWGPELLDSLAIEMLYGLLADLNKTTRFSGLPLGADSNAGGVLQASGWMTGFPMRTSFGRGFPEHDTWRFDAARLVDSGEADAALWISAYGREVPRWKKQIPLIALVPSQVKFDHEPQVRVEVGGPGVDHDSAEFAREVGAIVARRASLPSDAPSVSSVIDRIAQHIGGEA
ncbi:tungsten formylmethanofuran dehydrogenase [Methylocapsa acidiphila]|uniref:tungsten formylmethanofuran dehydrogenase n=1 Tax=Methylocapsa acidiphila TaxID=133552 RepID=UPI0004209E78|nr:tungsten formylmethanofuran dehydrogenase [Methylocapsa acidiphila]